MAVAVMTRFAEWLGARMKAREIGRSQLAAYLDTAPSTVGAWFTEDRIPSPDMCNRLAGVLGVRPEIVHRAAGHLPPDNDEVDEDDGIIEDLRVLLQSFSPSDQARVLLPMIRPVKMLREEMAGHEAFQSGEGPRSPDAEPGGHQP